MIDYIPFKDGKLLCHDCGATGTSMSAIWCAAEEMFGDSNVNDLMLYCASCLRKRVEKWNAHSIDAVKTPLIVVNVSLGKVPSIVGEITELLTVDIQKWWSL